jgi:hypothetical protein
MDGYASITEFIADRVRRRYRITFMHRTATDVWYHWRGGDLLRTTRLRCGHFYIRRADCVPRVADAT